MFFILHSSSLKTDFMKKFAFFTAMLLMLGIGIIHSCKQKNNVNPALTENSGAPLTKEELMLLPSEELLKHLKENGQTGIPSQRDGGVGGGGEPQPVLNCNEGPDCITGVELLQLVPQTPGFKFRIDLARTFLFVTTSEQFYNLPVSNICEYVVLAYPTSYANQLISAGVQNVIPIGGSGVAYQLPYHELESVFMFGLMDTDGSGNPGCEPHVDLRLYHRYGWDCFELHDVWCAPFQSIYDNTLRWETTQCENTSPPNTGNIKCPI